MKRNSLSTLLGLIVTTTPAAFGMNYTAPASPVLAAPVSVNLPHIGENQISTCTAASNTVAVGYELYAGGFSLLCADAGRIGFWTAPVLSDLVGHSSTTPQRFLCPSGNALAGVQYIEGLIFPLPLCGELIPDFHTGFVRRTVLVSVDGVVVEKESKNTPEPPGVISCGVSGYVQTLAAIRNSSDAVSGFSTVCNTIQTAPANIEDVGVDLAVRTVNQNAVLGRDSSQQFRVDVFNLGTAAMLTSNVSLELHFDGLAWQLQNFGNAVCSDILARKGIADFVVVGKRCTITGETTLPARGVVVSADFLLQPLGSDATRPASATPKPVVSAKVSVIDEHQEGADPNPANDFAAFPVILQ